MGMPRQVKKAVDEADAILAQLNAKPGETVPGETPPAPATPPVDQNNDKTGDQPPLPQVGSDPQPASTPAEDFEHKYNVLKGKYDSEIIGLQRTNQSLGERVQVLSDLVETLRATPPAPTAPAADDKKPGKTYIKPEDREEYGADMIDFVQRAAREAAEPEIEKLRAENNSLKQRLGHIDQDVAQTARDRALGHLASQVPDWEVVNKDTKFLAWLSEADVFSGVVRQDALLDAYNKNDGVRLVTIFKAFKREDSATAPTPPAPRSAAVDKGTLVAPGTPKGGTSSDAPGDSKKVWTQAEISSFYDQKRRNKIPKDVAEATEREIALATREGRVKL